MGAKKISILKIDAIDEKAQNIEKPVGQVVELDHARFSELNAAKPLAGYSPKEFRLLITYSPKEER